MPPVTERLPSPGSVKLHPFRTNLCTNRGLTRLWATGVWAPMLLTATWHSRALATRGVELGTDIQNYKWAYEGGGPSEDPLWTLLERAAYAIDLSFEGWLTLVLVLQAVLWMLFAFQSARILGIHHDFAALLVPSSLLLVQLYPYFVGGQTNILRAGLSTPLGALAVAALARSLDSTAAILLLAAVGVHRQVGVIVTVGFLAYLLLSRQSAI